ncbi:MAG TPA: ATP-binding cassette domain-containing protein, partial [Candidatus Poseidoniales archaeon]|nr:ATP-binding cassette domain-containing protein [Candidatus Poseidoniales archaeon]
VSLGARAGTPFRSIHDDVDGFLWSRRKNRVITAIDAVGLTDKMREPVRRLSGGQQRRVATARTLAQQPELILADEFLGELDERNVQIVVDAVKSLVERGSSMIMVEHHEYRAIELSNRVWRIKDGRLIEEVLT